MQTKLITKRIALIMLSAVGILMLGANLWAQSDSQAAYPSDYIYANEKAMEGYRTGQFPEGSVIVFDLLETRENAGTTVEGPRKFIDLMTKESKRYPETGGWGFEEFVGDSQTDRALTSEAKVACYSCHTKRKSNDFVFSTFRK